ncbi:Short repeat of unknown function [Butyrivibrio sp. ob235]|uniref:DUF308 domain-containing protein n=1 Tax=Butyrivibrio sp. ob235 TaxID=1761780 RepID=UPI0008BE7E55|nr:DUF308 domain-containing protein [Butyrivibrio sp. ob235]SEK24618.1 Short repeat of unknown function [Butyrivibrio sp. ob235]
MTRVQKIKSFIFSIFMIIAAVALILYPEHAYSYIVLILGVGLLFYGINTLIYFFTMARHMIGGKYMLYKGVIFTDFGYLTCTLNNIPRIYVILYLAILHSFTGLVEILRALENRSHGGAFKLKLAHGIYDMILAACCIIFIKETHTVVIIYSVGLIYSALFRFVGALRKNV